MDPLARDAKNRLRKTRYWLSSRMPLFGHLLLPCEIFLVPEDVDMPVVDCAIAADGTMYFNSKWVCMTPTPQLRAHMLHLVLHAALGVFFRATQYPLELRNQAHDLIVNWLVFDLVKGRYGDTKAKPIELPPGMVLDSEFKDISLEEAVQKLLQESPGGGGGGGGEGDDESEDGEGSGNEEGEGEGGGHSGPLPPDWHPDMLPSGSSTGLGRDAEGGNVSAQRLLEQKWKGNLARGKAIHDALQKGDLPAGLLRHIRDYLQPRIPWYQVLSQFIGEHAPRDGMLSFSRPTRRDLDADHTTLPGRIRDGFPEVTVLWDTSGSMERRVREVGGEILGICEDLGLRVRTLMVDAAVHRDVEVEAVEDIVEVAGFGGSDLRPAFDLLDKERNESLVLVFTDGYIDAPAQQPPTLAGTLWVLDERYGDKLPAVGDEKGLYSQVSWGNVLRVRHDGTADLQSLQGTNSQE